MSKQREERSLLNLKVRVRNGEVIIRNVETSRSFKVLSPMESENERNVEEGPLSRDDLRLFRNV